MICGTKLQVSEPALKRPESSALSFPTAVVREILGKTSLRVITLPGFFGKSSAGIDKSLSKEHASEQGKDDPAHVVINGVACIRS